MKPKRASQEEKHCWTHGKDDEYTSGSGVVVVGGRGVQEYAENGKKVHPKPKKFS